jgi:hypothetical protein
MPLMPAHEPVRARFTRCNGCRAISGSYLGFPGFCSCLAGTTDLGWKQLVLTPTNRRMWKYPQALKEGDRALTWGDLTRRHEG